MREASFNALGSLGVIEGARAVDLFAGTGALGIEALSRGAAHCVFVERDRAAQAVIARNLASTGLAAQGQVRGGTAESFVTRALQDGLHFDLALLDPPYAYAGWPALLASLPATVALIESDREIDPGPRWQVVRAKRYGTTLVAIARAGAPAPGHGCGETARPPGGT